MNDDEFTNFCRSLTQISESTFPGEVLKVYLKEIFEEFGIPELTAEQRGRVRKCKIPLSYVAKLSGESRMTASSIEGVYQPGSRHSWLYFCRELRTLILKTSSFYSGVSRWGMREESYTFIKYLTHDAAAELILRYKDDLKVFSPWEES
jgi:hypothetical protein